MGESVKVVGAGLAGCECALQLARRGVDVTLFEERPERCSAVHKGDALAQLVCSNSLKSTKPTSAAGLLKRELDAMGCVLLGLARDAAVPAGGALAVDRDVFSAKVEEAIASEPRIELVRHEVRDVPSGPAVICAGPLCSDALFSSLEQMLGAGSLAFYDAVAPIVDTSTIDLSVAFPQSRYEDSAESAGDYLNCPFDREGYEAFWKELVGAERAFDHDFSRSELFCACQPVEEVARTGVDALRFGALKPVGLTDPRTGRRPWAAVQLRAENRDRTAYNLVGFQTNLTWPEQRRVFRMIPGLEGADFFRYGVIHRNSFVDAPHVLDDTFRIPGTQVRLAGQICGTEGYVEAIASGLLAAANTYADLRGLEPLRLPKDSALGSLVAYATDPDVVDYQPMHVNFGLVPPLGGPRLKKQERYARYAERAMGSLAACIAERPDIFVEAANEGFAEP